MAESNAPKQDFAPPWLKFPPADSSKSSSSKSSNYPNDRNRQRREDPYSSRSDYGRLHRQSSFDYHEGKRFPPGQGKYRHHSVDDDYYNYPYNYGYYQPDYSYEKYGMQYSSQPSLARNGNRDPKFGPGRYSQFSYPNQMNGNHPVGFGPSYELFEPYYHHQGPRRGGPGHYERDYGRDSRDNRNRDRGNERDRPFSDDFPSLVGNGEANGEVKPNKPGSGVWAEERKAHDTCKASKEESADLLKNTSPGIYKALIPSKNTAKKPARESNVRMNGNTRDSSPLSPSSKTNVKESTRQSPTPELAIVTQPKKLGDKKSEFLKALRNESTIRNGEAYQDQNQNAIQKKQLTEESPMIEDLDNYIHINGNHTPGENTENKTTVVNGQPGKVTSAQTPVNGEMRVNGGEKLVTEVDHISLCGEDEEKRLLLSMGWDEEDNTEYVITDDEIREFQDFLLNHYNNAQQKNGLNSALRTALNKKLENHFACNGVSQAKSSDKPL